MFLSHVFLYSPLEELRLTISPPASNQSQMKLNAFPSAEAFRLRKLIIRLSGSLRLDESILETFKTCSELRTFFITQAFPWQSRQGDRLVQLLRCWPSLETLELNPQPPHCIRGEDHGLEIEILPQILEACPKLKILGACFSLPSPDRRLKAAQIWDLEFLDLGSSFFGFETVEEWPAILAPFIAACAPAAAVAFRLDNLTHFAHPNAVENEDHRGRVSRHKKNTTQFYEIYSYIQDYRRHLPDDSI